MTERLIEADAAAGVVEALFNELDDQLNCHDIKPYKWMADELLSRLKKLDYAAHPDASLPLRAELTQAKARIKELEEIVQNWERIGRRLANHDTNAQLERIINDANDLIEGGKDV